MTFEQWWAKNWEAVSGRRSEDIARAAWEAADAAGYERGRQEGHSEGWDERDEAGY